MPDVPRDDLFREYTFRDELIDDIEALRTAVIGGGRAPRFDYSGMSIIELEILFDTMRGSFDRWLRSRMRQRRASGSPVMTPARIGDFAAAMRSSFSGQDIIERSG